MNQEIMNQLIEIERSLKKLPEDLRHRIWLLFALHMLHLSSAIRLQSYAPITDRSRDYIWPNIPSLDVVEFVMGEIDQLLAHGALSYKDIGFVSKYLQTFVDDLPDAEREGSQMMIDHKIEEWA